MFKHCKIYYFIIALIAFIYVAIRAFTVGITYDEAYTINQLVSGTFLDIVRFKTIDANNHLLNTLIIKTLFTVFKHKLFIARLPNVIAFILYLVCCYKITSKNLSGIFGLGIFIMLISNPFLLDFFSLARGYGLALSFELLSLHSLILFFNNKDLKAANLSILFSAFAVLCNFSMLNYFVVLIGVINIIPFLNQNRLYFYRILFFTISISVILICIISNPIKLLIKNNRLYYGGNSNFYSDTLVSLTKYSCYTMHETILTHIILVSFLFTFFILLVLSYRISKKLFAVKKLLLSILILCIASTIVQHYALGTLYLIDRTALFLYPLFILVIGFSLNEIGDFKNTKKILVLLTILFTFNLLRHANFNKTVTWFFDAHTKEILSYLNKKGKNMNKSIRLYYSWPLESSIDYYYSPLKYPYVENNKEKTDCFNYETDYYIFCNQSLDKINYKLEDQTSIFKLKKDTLLKFESENLYLFHHLK